jgi:hypothetical protein
MRRILSVLVPAFLWLGACASAPDSGVKRSDTQKSEAGGAAPDANKEKEEAAAKHAQLERDLALADKRLEKTKLEMQHFEESSRDALARAEQEVDLSTMALKQFTDFEMKIKLDRSQHRLQMTKDGLEEAKEEMAQLEMMYKEQDLADKTREIVLRRGKRRVERAEAGLAIEMRDQEQLATQTLPLEEKRLKMDLESKQKALAQTRRTTEEALADKKIALMSCEFDVTKIKSEIEKTEKSEKTKKTP